jgi:hypothetical protein
MIFVKNATCTNRDGSQTGGWRGFLPSHENVFSGSWPFKKVLVIDRNLSDEQILMKT